ncbi:MAG: stage III sporulation protein AE [Eubacteriales bacterium]
MKAIAVFAAVLIVFLLPLGVMAYDNSTEEDIASRAGADNLPENEYVTDAEREGDKRIDIADKIFTVIKKSLTGFYKSGLKFFYSLLAVIVISAILSTFRWTSDNPSVKTVFDFVSVLVLAGVLFANLAPVFEFAASSLNNLCMYMVSFLPVIASLYALGGNISTGVAGSSSLIVFLTVSLRFSGVLLKPLLQTGFVISLMSALPGSVDMRSVTNFIKSSLTTLLSFVFTLFGVVMYFQTIIAAAADNYIYRTVKFASGVFIPVIGNIIGEAAKTVSTAVGVVKSTVGAVGLVTIMALVLPPVIYVIMYKIFILLAAITARMLGLEKESAILYDVNSFMSVLMSILVGTGVIFVIAVALFIRIGVGD